MTYRWHHILLCHGLCPNVERVDRMFDLLLTTSYVLTHLSNSVHDWAIE